MTMTLTATSEKCVVCRETLTDADQNGIKVAMRLPGEVPETFVQYRFRVHPTCPSAARGWTELRWINAIRHLARL